jgi:hypothetical protein
LGIYRTSVQSDVYFQVPVSDDVTQSISYDLAAIVCYIDYPHQHEKKNLVALINVGPSYHARSMGSPVSQWYIFNDFRLVTVGLIWLISLQLIKNVSGLN